MKLESIRKRNKLSQEKVAEILNVSMDELLGSTKNNELESLNLSNEEKVKEKRYYYNETRTKLISYSFLIIFLPLNIYFYNKGIYRQVYIELGFLGKYFLKDLLYHIPFIIILLGGLIKFIKYVKNSENIKLVIIKKDRLIGYLFLIVSLITMVVYFKFPPYSSIVMFLGMFVFVYVLIYEAIREITKRELELC